MNRPEAYQLDKKVKDPFYSDFDEDTNTYCVFGSESGFAYACYLDEYDAEEDAEEMNKELSSYTRSALAKKENGFTTSIVVKDGLVYTCKMKG